MGNGGKGRIRLHFPLEMGWYHEQPCTEFESLEHRKEPKGFRHEFIVLKLVDGSICRIERTGDPDARFDALSSQGSVAYDIAQCFRPKDLAGASLDTSEVIAEIHMPRRLDISDVLTICRAIQEGEKTRNYTLQEFNCYFFSLAIQCCVTRLVAEWELMIPRESWLAKFRTAIDSLVSSSRPPRRLQKETPHMTLLRAYAVLNPNDQWLEVDLLRDIQLTVFKRTDINQALVGAVNRVLWHTDLRTELGSFAKEVVKSAWLQVLRTKLNMLPGLMDPVSPISAKMSIEASISGMPFDESIQLLRKRCLFELIELIDVANSKHEKKGTRTEVLRPLAGSSKYSEDLPVNVRLSSKMDYKGIEAPQLVQTVTVAQWTLICWGYVVSVLYMAITVLPLWFLGVKVFDSGLQPRLCATIDAELNDMLAQLECRGTIDRHNMIEVLQKLRSLRKNRSISWSQAPWTELYQKVMHDLYKLPLRLEPAILKVSTQVSLITLTLVFDSQSIRAACRVNFKTECGRCLTSRIIFCFALRSKQS